MDLKNIALLSVQSLVLMALFVLLIVVIYLLSSWFGSPMPEVSQPVCGVVNGVTVCHA
jgi:hypothetical protein